MGWSAMFFGGIGAAVGYRLGQSWFPGTLVAVLGGALVCLAVGGCTRTESARASGESSAATSQSRPTQITNAASQVAKPPSTDWREELPWVGPALDACAAFNAAGNPLQQRQIADRRESDLEGVALRGREGTLSSMTVDAAGYPFVTVTAGPFRFRNTMGSLITPNSRVFTQIASIPLNGCVRFSGRVRGVALGGTTDLNDLPRTQACSRDLATDFTNIEACGSSTSLDDTAQADANVRALPWLNRVRELCRRIETDEIYDREVLERLEAQVDRQLSGHTIETLPGTVSYVGDAGYRVSITVNLLVGIGEDGSRNHIQFRRNLDPDSRVAAEARKLSIGDEIWWSASSYEQDSLTGSGREDCGVSFYTQFTSLSSPSP